MRTLTIILVTAFVFLLSLQLTAASRERYSEERGASQAVVAGLMGCFPIGELNQVFIRIDVGLGVIGISNDGSPSVALSAVSEECLDLLPALAEQVSDRVCEIGNAPDVRGSSEHAFRYVCTGRADVVISAIGKMAKAVTRLGQL